MKFTLPNLIASERVLVRLVAQSDLDAIFKVHSNEAVTRFLPYNTWQTMSDAHGWYERAKERHANQSAMQFVIVEKHSGAAIGTCLLFNFDTGSGRAEIGYSLGQDYWGAGYMQEALSALLGYAFGELGLRRLEAQIDPRNLSSGRLVTRMGFKKEGLLRQRSVMKGEVNDTDFYGLLRHEWGAPAA